MRSRDVIVTQCLAVPELEAHCALPDPMHFLSEAALGFVWIILHPRHPLPT